MSERSHSSHPASRAAPPWQDWLWSVLLHGSIGLAAWWFMYSRPTPHTIPIDTSIEWVSSSDSSGGGGGGGGGGGDGGDGTLAPGANAAQSDGDGAAVSRTTKKRKLSTKLAAKDGRNQQTRQDAAKITSTGDGNGSGVGSGSGGGAGSGSGTGTGSGVGSGVGSGEGSGVGSGVGSGNGAGYGSGSGTKKANWRSVLKAYLSSRKRYPNVARRLRQEGTVKVHASFSAQGDLLESWITSSSGHEELDEAALRLVRDASIAAAARLQPGHPVQIQIPVVYRLED